MHTEGEGGGKRVGKYISNVNAAGFPLLLLTDPALYIIPGRAVHVNTNKQISSRGRKNCNYKYFYIYLYISCYYPGRRHTASTSGGKKNNNYNNNR